MAISFTLNGKPAVYEGGAADRLLDVLRDHYRLTGVKCGCKEGECGACSVILDGRLVTSCMVAMGRVDGSEVVTIEGYRQTERFKALDAALLCPHATSNLWRKLAVTAGALTSQ